MVTQWRPLISGLMLFIVSTIAHAQELYNVRDNPEPSLEIGAQVFYERCTLCHGNNGMGEGLLPLKLKNYPNTNLLVPKHPIARPSVHDIVVYGGSRGEVSNLMPPMGNDLTWTQTESVVDFVLLLRNEHKVAAAMLAKLHGHKQVTLRTGQNIFTNRCVLCHGEYGEGNGRMVKVIKTPPPADLTASRLPDDYLKNIIKKGGAGVNRSPQMPPWGDQLNDAEIDSLILYLHSLRD